MDQVGRPNQQERRISSKALQGLGKEGLGEGAGEGLRRRWDFNSHLSVIIYTKLNKCA